MNDLMRPALYGANIEYSSIKKNIKSKKIYEFVGPYVKALINLQL